ncbi:hypothetical protein [Wenxinia saemankumensis]|uniref:Uncharacterized protein n=1 Tax=Wenxinia saemankumensis TaxID=1447782 RepID=A0A1M6GK09_9RHOB|nr:hypothetical protein [Wenxinia saemankumensis]SHJ10256.1 hypothetical protein SAMN05444417_2780 [Wenxinia saemankumensis]
MIAALLLTIIGLLGGILWALWPSAYVIDYDRGGRIGARAALIRAEVEPAEIQGRCMSACTMHLATGCVHSGARLIFHLPTPDTQHWREVLAGHYPPAIAAWFLSLPLGMVPMEMTGAEVIRLGARECPLSP